LRLCLVSIAVHQSIWLAGLDNGNIIGRMTAF
jgi:hypothetical protein